jgi:hypothetical protein
LARRGCGPDSEPEPIAKIPSARDNPGHDVALALVPQQGFDQIDLIHGDKLEDFGTHPSRGIASTTCVRSGSLAPQPATISWI